MSNSMMKWLPLHIASDVKGYFLKQYDEEIFLNLTILTLKGEMSIIQYCDGPGYGGMQNMDNHQSHTGGHV